MNDERDPLRTSTRLINETTADIVANVIRQRIITGELKPEARINIEDIAKEMNVSSTPVREAIRTLQAEQLVGIDPRKGLRIKSITIEELTEIYELRRFLEAYAVRHAVNNYSETDIQALRTIVEKMEKADYSYPKGEYWRLHREFHRRLATYGKNSQWVQRFLELLWQNAERYRALYAHGVKSMEKIHEDHRRLLEAATNRNEKLLLDLLDEHIEDIQKIIISSLEESKDSN